MNAELKKGLTTERNDLISSKLTFWLYKIITNATNTMDTRHPGDAVPLKLLKSPDQALIFLASVSAYTILSGIQAPLEVLESFIRKNPSTSETTANSATHE